MLNKKGFTIAEVIVSFSMISIILFSLISSTTFYRDKVKEEEVRTQLWDFKNNITKIVYDDIVEKKINRAESCIGAGNGTGTQVGSCVNLYDAYGRVHVLKIDEYETGDNKGVFLSYDGVKYRLPDSDLGMDHEEAQENERICDFIGGFEVSSYENELYKVKLMFRHRDLDITHELLFIIS